MADAGSSPHARGTASNPGLEGNKLRFIPACAGNRCHHYACVPHPAVHPRMRGEQMGAFDLPVLAVGSSPRVWGTAG